jgi:O-antigen/teichoic acid export membrane protein
MLSKNTAWSLAGSSLPLLAAIAFIPFMLHMLGYEAFGVLTLIWAVIGYFSLFDMGIGRALTYELSKLRARTDIGEHELNREMALTLRAGLLIALLAGAVGTALVLAVAQSMATDWLKIDSSLRQDAQYAFAIVALGIVPTTLTSGLRGALEGLNRFADSNVNRIIFGFWMFALPALSIYLHGNNLVMIASYLVLARYVLLVATLTQLKRYLLAPIKPANATLGALKLLLGRSRTLLSYGFWMAVTGIVGPLMVVGDRFLIGAIMGAMILPLYAIPQEALQRLLIIPAALGSALLPQLTAMHGLAAVEVYTRNYKRLALIMLIVCSLAAIAIYPLLSWWISKDFADKAIPIALMLCFGVFLNGMAVVPYTFIHSTGNTKLTALFHLFQLVIYCVVLFALTVHFGLIGAAWTWILRAALDLGMLHHAASKIIQGGKN